MRDAVDMRRKQTLLRGVGWTGGGFSMVFCCFFLAFSMVFCCEISMAFVDFLGGSMAFAVFLGLCMAVRWGLKKTSPGKNKGNNTYRFFWCFFLYCISFPPILPGKVLDVFEK